MSENKKDSELVEKLKDIFDSVVEKEPLESYPKEALPLGTLVRSNRIDRLGVITDSFYGEVDKDGKKIIIYTLLLFPKKNNSFTATEKNSTQYYLTNEYEYEITAYLMMNPINLSHLTKELGGNLFL